MNNKKNNGPKIGPWGHQQ